VSTANHNFAVARQADTRLTATQRDTFIPADRDRVAIDLKLSHRLGAPYRRLHHADDDWPCPITALEHDHHGSTDVGQLQCDTSPSDCSIALINRNERLADAGETG
jgi:hypothetical protein